MSDREASEQGSERAASPASQNGHSPRPAGGDRDSRSRSRSNSRHERRRSRSRSPRRESNRSSRRSEDRGEPKKRSRSPMSSRRRHQGTRDNPPTSRCLGVFGLSMYTEERDLKDIFSKYGPIEDVQIVFDAQTGRSRGFAFIYFENKADAEEAKEHCNGLDVSGRQIRVDYSITTRAHTPTPGIYMGKPSDRRDSGRGFRRDDRRDSGRGYGGGGGRDRDRGFERRRRSPSPSYDRRRGGGGRSRSRSPRRHSYRY